VLDGHVLGDLTDRGALPGLLFLLHGAQHAQRREAGNASGVVDQAASPTRSLPDRVDAYEELVEFVVARH
jgi:hypothetical protein